MDRNAEEGHANGQTDVVSGNPPVPRRAPARIQRRRTRGWRMPENAVYVGRPTKWGNPFEVGGDVTRQDAVQRYAIHLANYFGWVERELARAFYPWPVQSTEFLDWIKPLRGKDLACWCSLSDACHADLLLKLANHEP